MGCRFTTAFRALTDRARLRPGEKLAVHGCGGIGLSAIVIGAALGAEIYAVDVNPDALALAQKMGAHHLIKTSAGHDAGERVRDASGGGVHVSLDGLGITDTYLNSLNSLRKLGRHVQIGMPLGPHANPVLPLLDLVYSRQISLFGTRGMGADRFAGLFQLISEKGIDLNRLVSREITLSQAGAAIAAMDGYDGVGISVITKFQD